MLTQEQLFDSMKQLESWLLRLIILCASCTISAVVPAAASPISAGLECKVVKDKAKRLLCFDAINFKLFEKAEPEQPKPKKWDKEPSSFLSIVLGEKIELAIPDRCPSERNSVGSDDFNRFKWEKQGKPLCQLLRTKGGMIGGVKYPRWYVVWGSGIDELRRGLRVDTDDDGIVNSVSAVFYSSESSALYSALLQRFGEPTETSATTMRLNNGSSIPGMASTWIGKQAVLQFSSHSLREADHGIVDLGEVSFTSTAYIDQKLNERAATALRKSEKF